LYTITENGLFCFWDLKTLQKIQMKNIEQETKFMIVCKFSPKIIISMNFEIVVLKNKDNFQIDSKYSLQYSSEIV
jgi:hypothetical protein